MPIRFRKINKLFVGCFLCLTLNACGVYEKIATWEAVTYAPEQYHFAIDSTFIEKYGREQAQWRIEIGEADQWITDSVVYCFFYLEQEQRKLPLVPYCFSLQRNKKQGMYKIDTYIADVKKQYKTLDSIIYKLYNRSGQLLAEGGFSYSGKAGLNADSLLEKPDYMKYMPYGINIAPDLNATDTLIYGDIALFFTDKHRHTALWSTQNIAFKYHQTRGFRERK